jgi:hypothetical protein
MSASRARMPPHRARRPDTTGTPLGKPALGLVTHGHRARAERMHAQIGTLVEVQGAPSRRNGRVGATCAGTGDKTRFPRAISKPSGCVSAGSVLARSDRPANGRWPTIVAIRRCERGLPKRTPRVIRVSKGSQHRIARWTIHAPPSGGLARATTSDRLTSRNSRWAQTSAPRLAWTLLVQRISVSADCSVSAGPQNAADPPQPLATDH